MDGRIRWSGDRPREGAVLEVNVEHPIVTSGDFVVYSYSLP